MCLRWCKNLRTLSIKKKEGVISQGYSPINSTTLKEEKNSGHHQAKSNENIGAFC